MKIINTYLLKTLFNYFLLVLAVWVIIFVLFDLIVEAKDIGKNGYSLIDIIYVEILKIPSIIYRGDITIILITTVLALNSLVLNSEMIVMQSSGKSMFSIIITIAFYALLFMFVTVFVFETYGAQMHKNADNYKNNALQQIDKKQNIWLKKDDFIINIKQNYDGKSFANLLFFKIIDNQLEFIINAKRGVIQDEKFILSEVRKKSFDINKLEEEYHQNYIIDNDFNPDIIGSFSTKKDYVSAINLYQHINFLAENNIIDDSFKIELTNRFLRPIILLISIMFVSLFIFGSIRQTSMGKKFFLAIAISLFFELILRISSVLSLKFSYNYTYGSIIILIILFFTILRLLIRKSNE